LRPCSLPGQIERGRRLGCAREPDQHDVRLVKALGAPAVVMPQRVLDRVDALEIPFVDPPQQARRLERLLLQVSGKIEDQRPQDIVMQDVVLHAVHTGVVAHLLLDEREGDERLGRLGLVEDLFEVRR